MTLPEKGKYDQKRLAEHFWEVVQLINMYPYTMQLSPSSLVVNLDKAQPSNAYMALQVRLEDIRPRGDSPAFPVAVGHGSMKAFAEDEALYLHLTIGYKFRIRNWDMHHRVVIKLRALLGGCIGVPTFVQFTAARWGNSFMVRRDCELWILMNLMRETVLAEGAIEQQLHDGFHISWPYTVY